MTDKLDNTTKPGITDDRKVRLDTSVRRIARVKTFCNKMGYEFIGFSKDGKRFKAIDTSDGRDNYEFTIFNYVFTIINCKNCKGCEWVCENHTNKPWDGMSDHKTACGCGAGQPCDFCNPLSNANVEHKRCLTK